MARVFTIEFVFKQHTHKAIVVARGLDTHLKIYIRVFDGELKEILGKDSIEFEGITGYRALDSENRHPDTQELLKMMSEIIVEHLLK